MSQWSGGARSPGPPLDPPLVVQNNDMNMELNFGTFSLKLCTAHCEQRILLSPLLWKKNVVISIDLNVFPRN